MASSSEQTPISPVKFNKPELTISAAAINNEPIELDSTPLSAEDLRMARRGSKAAALEALDAEKGLSSSEREVCCHSKSRFLAKADLCVATSQAYYGAKVQSCCAGRYPSSTSPRGARASGSW